MCKFELGVFMASSVRSSKLENRTQRSKLKVAHRPYWVGIGQGLYLGYRKGIKGGVWITRYYLGRGKYIIGKLGKGDDHQDANGIDVLDYFQAQEHAREFADQQARFVSGEVGNKSLTVTEAISNYLGWFKEHRKSHQHTQYAARLHILPMLGDKLVNRLTTPIIRKWHESLIKEPPRLRGTPVKTNYASVLDTKDAVRMRKATANRILTILKASLNHAWREGLVASDEAWRKVRPFHNVDAPRVRYLELSECQRLINACEPDFRKLVRAALLTGCRYSELVRLKVHDFNAAQGAVYIRETKNGKPRHIPLTSEGNAFFDEITAGKLGDELIFTHSSGEEWGSSHQIRRLRDACKIAKIKPEASFHILRHTYGSLLASKGVPLQVIAELLGHSDTRITSRHYAHLMPSFVSDTLRANLPNFVNNKEKKVIKIKA